MAMNGLQPMPLFEPKADPTNTSARWTQWWIEIDYYASLRVMRVCESCESYESASRASRASHASHASRASHASFASLSLFQLSQCFLLYVSL
jgi:hypothetical protein